MDIEIANEVILEVRLSEDAKAKGLKAPTYSRTGDAGLDLPAAENLEIKPGQRVLVGTGLQVAIPSGFVGFIKDRSGLAAKNGLHTLAGVVDSNYRGEVKVVILNTSQEDYHIEIGNRIAQLIILPLPQLKIVEKDFLNQTNRNQSGWGSSGKS